MAELRPVVELVVQDELSAGVAAATASLEKFDAQVRRTTPTAEGLARKLDQVTKAEAALAAVLDRNATRQKTLDEGLRLRKVTAEQYAGSLATMAAEQTKAEANLVRARGAAAGAAVGADALAKSTKDVNYQMRALTQQMPDVVSGLLTGQKPFMILVQQGGQVVQVMGGVGAALRGVVTYLGGPWMVAAVAAAATMGTLIARSAELANEQRQLDVALRAVGATGVTSAAALADYVRQLERAGVAKDTALQTGQSLARNPMLTQQDIQRAMQLAPDLAAGLGIDVPESAKRLADALAGGYDGVKKLDDAINLLTVDQRNAIKVMLEHGDTTKAADLLYEGLQKRFKGLAEDALGPMGRALRDVAKAWAGFMDEIAKSDTVIAAVRLLGEAVQGMSMIVRGDTGSRPAPPSQPGDAEGNQIASLTMERDRLMQRYTAARQGQGPALTGPMLQSMEAEIGRLNTQITDIQARQAAIIANSPTVVGGGAVSTQARPQSVTDQNEGLAPPDLMRRRAQMNAVNDATEADRRQIEVLRAGLPVRAAVQARIEATAEAGRRGYEGAARTAFIETRVAAATAAAGDAAAQHLAATQREAVGLVAVAQAADRGRAAMIVAKAATEAHEQAATQAGVAEAALRDAIINRAAAQEAEKGAEKIVELREQADAIAALIAAEQKSPQDAYWAKVNEKVRVATLSLEAHRDAATDPKVKAALDAEIARIRQLIPQVERLGVAYEFTREKAADDKQIAVLQKEIELVGRSADERERELAIFKARQAIKENGGDLNNLTAEESAYLANKTRLADLASELRRHQNLYDELGNSATRVFETVGDAITQAYTQGSGAAVKWGTVSRGVMSAVMQQAMKLAIVNPILNGLFGGERASIWTAVGGGAAGAAGGGGGILSQLGQLTGLSNLLPSGGLSGMWTSASNYLFGTPTTYAIVDPTGIPSAVAGEPGLFGTAGATSLGQVLGGFGLGFGAGNLLNGLIGGNQTNGMIGSGLGSAAGAALALAIPGIGPFLAPLIGGLLGGAGGGLIGPHQSVRGYGFRLQSAGWGPDAAPTNAMASSLLPIDRTFYNEEGAAAFQAGDQLVAQTNAYLAARNLTVGGVSVLGGNRHGADYSWADAGTLGEAFSRLRFGATDNADLNRALGGKTFTDVTGLQTFVEGLISAQDTIKQLTADPVPAFTAQMDAITKQFDDASAAAQKYGISETALTAARARAIAKLEEQRAETMRQTATSLNIRYMRVTGRTVEADIAAQAEAASQELRAFGEQLDALAVTAAEKTDFLARLTIVQAAEAQQLRQQQADALVQPLLAAGANIRQYLDNLASGTGAGASPADRLSAAQAAFTRDLTLAQGGDSNALGRITQQADAYLAAGRDVHASGSGYQAILQQVTTGLGSLPAVQSYDAQMAASLDAIHQLFVNGTAGTLTTISATGNIVQIQAGTSMQAIVDAQGATNNALALINSSIVSGLGVLTTGMASVNDNIVSTSRALNQSQAALGEIAAGANTANVTSLAALGTIAAATDAHTVASLAAANTIAADAAANSARLLQALLDAVTHLEARLSELANAGMAAERGGFDDVVDAVNSLKRPLERAIAA